MYTNQLLVSLLELYSKATHIPIAVLSPTGQFFIRNTVPPWHFAMDSLRTEGTGYCDLSFTQLKLLRSNEHIAQITSENGLSYLVRWLISPSAGITAAVVVAGPYCLSRQALQQFEEIYIATHEGTVFPDQLKTELHVISSDELRNLKHSTSTTVSLLAQYFIPESIDTSLDNTTDKATCEELATFKTLTDHAAYGVAITNMQGEILYINNAFANLHGLHANNLLNRHISVFHHENQLAQVNEMMDELSNCGTFTTDEMWHWHQLGYAFPTITHANLFPATDGSDGFIAISAADISASKLAQATTERDLRRLSTLISGMDEGFVFIDVNDLVVEINDYACRFIGIERDDFIGKSVTKIPLLVDADVVNGISDQIDTYKSGKSADSYFSQFAIGASEVMMRMQPIFHNGVYDGFLLNIVNVTELVRARKEAENAVERVRSFAEQLEQKNQELDHALTVAQSATRTKSEFLAKMSHEIRTPMNGILGMASLLSEMVLSNEQRDFVNTILQSAESLLTIINDILDFSKLEAGRIELEQIVFNLHNVLESAAEIMALKAQQKGLEFVLEIEEGVPASLTGDPGRIRQVVNNLWSNALKFTEHGEVTTRVHVTKKSEEDIVLKFEIIDTGIGIPPNKLDRLFKSFSQVDASTTRKYGGTGLGLVICKELVETMGGSIGLSSSHGEGSTFWFTLPFKPNEEVETEQLVFPDSIKGQRVLIVDDNASCRENAKKLLERWGVVCETVTCGHEAISVISHAKVDQSPFALALIDSAMPEMTGIELAEQLSEQTDLKPLPMVLLTTAAHRGSTEIIKAAGFISYLIKPLRQNLLFESVLNILSASKRQERNDQLATEPIGREDKKAISTCILLAEDNPVNQKVAISLLKKGGYNFELADNGMDAVQMAATGEYDLILMDCQMPEMDGLEATTAIRQLGSRFNKIPIIAMTANAMEGDRETCIAAGMDDYISKPVQADVLYQIIEKHLLKAGHSLENVALPTTPVDPSRSAIKKSKREESISTQVDDNETQSSIDVQPVDLDASVARAGDPEFWQELVDAFLEETEQGLERLEAAITASEASIVQREAHTIKGGAAELVAEQLRQAAYDLEMIGKSGDLREASEALATVHSHFITVQTVLKEHVHKILSINE